MILLCRLNLNRLCHLCHATPIKLPSNAYRCVPGTTCPSNASPCTISAALKWQSKLMSLEWNDTVGKMGAPGGR